MTWHRHALSAAFIGLGLALVALRWVNLGVQSLWFDEGYTAWLVSHRPSEIVDTVRFDTAPPLYYLILHHWTQLFGRTEFALRALSALASSLTLVLTSLLAWRLTRSARATLVAMLFVGLSPLLIQYAQEARFYALMSLLSVALFGAVVRLRETGHWRWTVPVTVLSAASLYTHNAMLFTLAGIVVAALAWPGTTPIRSRRALLQALCVSLGTLLLYVPWFAALVAQTKHLSGAFWVDRPTVFSLTEVLSLLSGGGNFRFTKSLLGAIKLPVAFGSVVVVTLISTTAVLLVGARQASSIHRRRLVCTVIAAMLPVMLLFVYSLLLQPLFMDKLLITSVPLLGVALALAVSGHGRFDGLKWTAALVVLLISTSSTVGFLHEEQKENWRAATRYVNDLPPAPRLLVFVANEGQLPFDYYDEHRHQPRTGAPIGFLETLPRRTMQRVTDESDLTHLRSVLSYHQSDEIVLILSHEWWADPKDLVRGDLSGLFDRVSVDHFHGVTVERFKPRAHDDASDQ